MEEATVSREVYEDFADTCTSRVFLQLNIIFPFPRGRSPPDTDSEWQADFRRRLVIPLQGSLGIHEPVSAELSRAMCVRTD